MLPSSYCFVDLETTGTNAYYNRIIEIGIVKVEHKKIVKTYKQLINPEAPIDPCITTLTGIHTEDLQNVPTFYEVKDEIYDMLQDSVFVAHNVRFDYGFLRNEFKNCGMSFTSKHFCTVKLARLLYPSLKRYNLDSIIENFNITCKQRHRAFDDAKAIYEFFSFAKKQFPKDDFEKAVSLALKRPTVPIHLTQDVLDNLPETPGVYIFYGETGVPIYIGKSVNIHDRVLSHFSNDYLSTTDMKISKQVFSIDTIQTAGELGALLLESSLIKKHMPLFNKKLRQSRRMIILLKTEDTHGYHMVEEKEVEDIAVEDTNRIIGVFRTKQQVKDFLYEIAKAYSLCPKLLNLEKTSGYCFYYQLHHCFGACKNEEKPIKYNLRFDEAFYKCKIKPWKFDGPILVKEKGALEEGFVIDKWCLLGNIKNTADITDLSNEYRFDLDTYKIIDRFFRTKDAKIQVQLLKDVFPTQKM